VGPIQKRHQNLTILTSVFIFLLFIYFYLFNFCWLTGWRRLNGPSGEKKKKKWTRLIGENQIKSNQINIRIELLFLLFFKALVWGQSRTREDKWSMTRQSNAV